MVGSWIGFTLCCMCILATIYVACNPGGAFDVKEFFQNILTLPIVIFCYVLWKVWKRPDIVKLSEADLISGRRELDLREERKKDELERRTWGPIKRYIRQCYHISRLVFIDFFVNLIILRPVSLLVVSIIYADILLFDCLTIFNFSILIEKRC